MINNWIKFTCAGERPLLLLSLDWPFSRFLFSASAFISIYSKRWFLKFLPRTRLRSIRSKTIVLYLHIEPYFKFSACRFDWYIIHYRHFFFQTGYWRRRSYTKTLQNLQERMVTEGRRNVLQDLTENSRHINVSIRCSNKTKGPWH